MTPTPETEATPRLRLEIVTKVGKGARNKVYLEATMGRCHIEIGSCLSDDHDKRAALREIVRCVNSHQALVESLGALIRAASTDRVSKKHIADAEVALKLAGES